jgi:L-Ala-D/L-Glu epimerase
VRNIVLQQPQLTARTERWRFKKPFRITGYEFTDSDVLVVEARIGDACGRGEALGVYYRNDEPEDGRRQIDELVAQTGRGRNAEDLVAALPPGGARNAADCALWDLRAKLAGEPVWRLLGLDAPKPVRTTYTVGAGELAEMVETAREYVKARALKVKLTGGDDDASRLRAIRAARPDVWLGVDGNQGFTRESLARLMPVLQECRVELIEQPFPIGREADLDGLASPISIAADESVQDSSDLQNVEGRVEVVNVKLDKCGGLTEGFAMLGEIRRMRMRPMVGCMGGTSLSMAPGFVLGQLCDVVDLDGPILYSSDREPSATYDGEGCIFVSDDVWGGPR